MPEGPARRGRKDPQIAQRIEMDEASPMLEGELHADAGEEVDTEVFVYDGDQMFAKISHGTTFMGNETWHTVGYLTRAQPDDTLPDLFNRAYGAAEEASLMAICRTYGIEPQDGDTIVSLREALLEAERELRSNRRIRPNQ